MKRERETCADKYEVGKESGLINASLQECKINCNEDNACNFIFYKPWDELKNCLKYSSCRQKRLANHRGSTYSKGSSCQGNE